MKTITSSIILLFLISTVGFSQSKSFEILRDKFHGCENVFAFNTSGFIARTILWVGGECPDDYYSKNCIQRKKGFVERIYEGCEG
jgi:hypothetical protein